MTMSSEATKIPSPMARIIEMLTKDDTSGVASLATAVAGIGATMAGAGVVAAAAGPAVASLGQFALDPSLPNLAGGQGMAIT